MEKENLKPLKELKKFPSCKLDYNFRTCDVWHKAKLGCFKCHNYIKANNTENS